MDNNFPRPRHAAWTILVWVLRQRLSCGLNGRLNLIGRMGAALGQIASYLLQRLYGLRSPLNQHGGASPRSRP